MLLGVQNVLLGGLSGVALVLVTHPLTLLRTKLAADLGGSRIGEKHEKLIQIPREYSGPIQCSKEVFEKGGPKEFYKGFLPVCFNIFIHRGIFFGVYDTLQMNRTMTQQS